MLVNLAETLIIFSALVLSTQATVDPKLTGTWSTKSRQVITGPGFYNPSADRLIEPSLTGISYSFTDDGFYEEAYYRAVSNPTRPECAEGIMQWQHGSYSLEPNGSLVLTPIPSDGRQLSSNPCVGKSAAYTRYNQTETFKSYNVHTDAFHDALRLDLYQFDGSPMQPLYIVYNPPEMLPTTTLNPTHLVTSAGKVKRDIIGRSTGEETLLTRVSPIALDIWWWFGIIATIVGGLALVFS